MKKTAYLVVIISLVFTIFSCDQEINFPYEGKDKIHFKHFTVSNGNRSYIDSTTFSFGLKNDAILKDTLRVVVELVGNISSVDRNYRIEIIADSTTAEEGVHYEKFSLDQVLRANRINDTLKIVFLREHLSSDYSVPENKRLDLKLLETSDLAIGLAKGTTTKLLVNNFMSEPGWWDINFRGGLGYFHPKKWKILISFNEKFATEEDCPFNINNEGRTYLSGLQFYFDRNIVYDYMNGKKYRIEMYQMTEVKE